MSDGGDKIEMAQATTSMSSTPAKKPYMTPKLRHLGSVRRLTLGSPGGIVSDGGAGTYIRAE